MGRPALYMVVILMNIKGPLCYLQARLDIKPYDRPLHVHEGTLLNITCSAAPYQSTRHDLLVDPKDLFWTVKQKRVPKISRQVASSHGQVNMYSIMRSPRQVDLIIKNVQREHTGKYHCSYKNVEFKEIRIQVVDEDGRTTCPHFQCEDSRGCFLNRYRCDGVKNCQDASDEADCRGKCSGDSFACRNGDCIPRSNHCDRQFHCKDHSDELFCPRERIKPKCKHFLCQDPSTCIFSIFRCNGRKDCSDGSDEVNCRGNCSQTGTPCDNGDCIPKSHLCNGNKDCKDGSDETRCFNQVITLRYPPDHNNDSSTKVVRVLKQSISLTIMGVSVALVSVISVVVIACCRIRMKRQAVRHIARRQRQRRNSDRPQRHSTSDPRPFGVHDIQLRPLNVTTNVEVNINLHINDRPARPPPYSEIDSSGMEAPPPPYSSICKAPSYRTLARDNEQTIMGGCPVQQHTEDTETALLAENNTSNVL